MAVTLPYYRESDQLPSPLPDQHEISTATHHLPTIRNPDYDGRIVVIRNQYVVKYGTYVNENEGHALLFIERHLSIPVPRLYAMYRDANKVYLIMQYIPGIELHVLWPSLSEEEKGSIMGQLQQIFRDIQSLPSEGSYGSVVKGPLQHRYFFSRDHNPAVTGPFETEESFNLAIAERSRLNWADNGNGIHGWISDWLRRNLPSALKEHRSTFTHSDLHRQNILIRKTLDELSGNSNYTIAAIVDWETAGWYPAYWEYAAAFALFQWVDDWPENFEKIIDPWPLEAAMLRFIQQDLEF